tara:strand:+ start:12755 stop:13081 length:327 start_codon:yes stop_codon:yes gene_type:complete
MSEWLWKQSSGQAYVYGLWQESAPKNRKHFIVERPDGTGIKVQVANDGVARTLAGELDANGYLPVEPPEPEFDPLTVKCPRCRAGVGEACKNILGKEMKIHKAREGER